MGKVCRGKLLSEAALPTELLPYSAGQIGFEPMTRDNPQLRPIKVLAYDNQRRIRNELGGLRALPLSYLGI